MEYREIVAVTGLGGLFQLLTTKSDGAIVRNLVDKTTKFIPARVHNVTPIESIEIYTLDENVRLHTVLQLMKDNESTTPPVDAKKVDGNGIKSYFKAIFPQMDEQRVYVSDMKKILKWYELLKENNLLNFEAYNEATVAEQTSDEAIEASTEDAKPAKKARTKKNEEEPGTDTEDTAKPAKKARAKKDEEETTDEEKPAKKVAKKKKTEE